MVGKLDYKKALPALLEIEGQRGDELTKKLVQLLAGSNGAELLDTYLLEIKKQYDAPGYPNLSELEKSFDEQEIYHMLKESGPMTTEQLMEMSETTKIQKSLRYRTHMSAKLNEMKERGWIGLCTKESKNKLYSTSERAVKNALGERNLDKYSAYRPENIWAISEDTELAPVYVLRVLDRIALP